MKKDLKRIVYLSLSFVFILSSLFFFKIKVPKVNNVSFRVTDDNYNSYTWADFAANNTIGTESGIEVHIANQEALEQYLKRTGNDLTGDMIWLDNNENIIFPTGTYTFSSKTEFYLTEASGDIDFNEANFAIGGSSIYMNIVENQHNRNFENLTVYGTGSGIGIYIQAIHASNMNFSNLDFNNAQIKNSHVFDIMACTNFNFKNITNRGYMYNLNDYSGWDEYDSTLQADYENNINTITREFIQVDIYSTSSSGHKSGFLSDTFKTNYFDVVDNTTNITSKNIVIDKVRSVSYAGVTGSGIISGENTVVYKPYSSPIGSHAIGNEGDYYTGIVVKNSYFENTVRYDHNLSSSKNNLWRFAPVRFLIIPTNSVTTTDIPNSSQYLNTDITLDNNEYINCNGNFSYPEYVNNKNPEEYYLKGFNPTMQVVNSIKLVDTNGNTINTYDGYYAEEPIYNDYVFVSSSYNNGVLTRVYRKALNSINKIENNIDINGNLLSSISGYKLNESKVTSSTTETLPNGDSITVEHVTNIYKRLENPRTSIVEDEVKVEDTAISKSIIYYIIGITLFMSGSIMFVLTIFKK